jgi:hypothetical protein
MTPDQLSPNTRKTLATLVEAIRQKLIPEEFDMMWDANGVAFFLVEGKFVTLEGVSIQKLHIEALGAAELLFSHLTFHEGREMMRRCYITPEGYGWVDSGFTESSRLIEESGVPVEITESLRRFREAYPNPLRSCFLMMRFGSTALHTRLTKTIREALTPYEIDVLRADDKEFHEDLYSNVLTYVYGCSFGIAVFERIEQDEFNPNISLEVGLMFGLRKKVCILKDKNLKTLHADLVGKLYKPFDPIEPEKTVPKHLKDWLQDKDIIRLPPT